MNVLVLYRSQSTVTNALYQHLLSLKTFSSNTVRYMAVSSLSALAVDLSNFQAIIVHNSIRLPFDHLSARAAARLKDFRGVKALFIQDEYDNPRRAIHWMNDCEFDIVFTCVPERSIDRIYRLNGAGKATFVPVLTGYAEDLPGQSNMRPPSERAIVLGYRGTELPLRYGRLGREKVSVARRVNDYCGQHKIATDISWSNDKRLYGAKWYEFLANCRASLATESGCNVFDWDNDLDKRVAAYRVAHPTAGDDEIYHALIAPLEVPNLTNQISPRCFEAIALKSVLVLYEGEYSSVLDPAHHYLPLKRDFSNLSGIMERLADGAFCDAMADRAYADIVGSQKFSYRTFVALIDAQLENYQAAKPQAYAVTSNSIAWPKNTTALPIRQFDDTLDPATFRDVLRGAAGFTPFGQRLAYYIWGKVPERARAYIKPRLRRALGID